MAMENILTFVRRLRSWVTESHKTRNSSSNPDRTQQAELTAKQRIDQSRALWDASAGEMLDKMLRLTNMSDASLHLHRSFFADDVAASLGPHPDLEDRNQERSMACCGWKSFMTDDHTPIELSWNWSSKSSTPIVRYSVEPISWRAGTIEDRRNTTAGPALLGRTLPLSRDLDLQWYRHFLDSLTLRSSDLEGDLDKEDSSSASQTFIAFDLQEDGVVVKYYFMPSRRAALENKSNFELIHSAISKLALPENCFAASLDMITEYVGMTNESDKLVAEIAAVDCVAPAQSRIKIYVRSRNTTFASMRDLMTLGGRLPAFTKANEASLRELWCAVFGIDPESFSPTDRLPGRDHRTAGILYYLELKANSPRPKVKVYLPVRHYAHSDEQIARGLSDFLKRRDKGLVNRSYYDGVTRLCTHRKLEAGLGFHTYVSCAVDGDSLAITSYFNPEIYYDH